MDEPGLLSERHPLSGRSAVVEDDGRSAWLYLTRAGTQDLAADCWIYNRLPAAEEVERAAGRGGPPPAVRSVAGERARIEDPRWSAMRLVWSADGESVAFVYQDDPLAFIARGEKAGYSRNVVRTSPWGRLWDPARFDALFRRPAP